MIDSVFQSNWARDITTPDNIVKLQASLERGSRPTRSRDGIINLPVVNEFSNNSRWSEENLFTYFRRRLTSVGTSTQGRARFLRRYSIRNTQIFRACQTMPNCERVP